MLRAFFVIACLAATPSVVTAQQAASSAPAAAQSQQVLWGASFVGMSLPEVMAAFPAATEIEDGRRELDGAVARAYLKGTTLFGWPFDVKFFFHEAGLSYVAMAPAEGSKMTRAEGSRLGENLKTSLSAKYGRPINEENTDNVYGFIRKAAWLNGASTVEFTHIQFKDGMPAMMIQYGGRAGTEASKL